MFRISALRIVLPPIAEQRRIASILDAADALRAKRREAIVKLDELTQSAKPVEIFTTNGTQLLEGFYLFLLFCISSLILSEIVTRKT